jgi:quercetin dioxygenase-like cupin family protein
MTLTGERADALWFLDNIVSIRLRGEEVGERFSIVEMRGPAGHAPPLHRHLGVDEGFYVLEGDLTFFEPGRSAELRPGGFFLGPRDVAHTFRVGSSPARWLAICVPAGFERFIAAVAEPARGSGFPPTPDVPPDPEKLAQIAARFGIEILGPPGTLP